MNHDPLPQPQVPMSDTPEITKQNKNGLSIKWIIVIMLWPVPLLIITIALYAALAFIFPDTSAADGELFAATSPVRVGTNIILFLVGAAAVAFGPISFITGLVLLIVRSGNKKQ